MSRNFPHISNNIHIVFSNFVTLCSHTPGVIEQRTIKLDIFIQIIWHHFINLYEIFRLFCIRMKFLMCLVIENYKYDPQGNIIPELCIKYLHDINGI